MATNAQTKIFGSALIPAGTYLIADATNSDEVTTINNQEVKYVKLALNLSHFNAEGEPTGKAGSISLNGCWRPRRGSDGQAYQASGTFYTELLKACQGKSFEETAQYITNTFKDKKVKVDYLRYPLANTNGFGNLPIINFVD
jgi:hypothetical protein